MPEDPTVLVDEIGRQFEVARSALRMIGIGKQFQTHAREAPSAAEMRVVRVKAVSATIDPATGRRRGRGRPALQTI